VSYGIKTTTTTKIIEYVQLYLAFYYFLIKYSSLISAVLLIFFNENLAMFKNRRLGNALETLAKDH
jgi:hypothetical protein